ncbi:MAG: GAF domain-containing protein [Thermoflexales bacterium]|nr:GAF domain-containing protein [Thermoflexales bacterium]
MTEKTHILVNDNTKRAEDATCDKIATLQSMAEINREIMTATEPQEILDLVCRRAAELVHVKKSAIATRMASGDMEMTTSYGLNDAERACGEFASFWQVGLARLNRLKPGVAITIQDTLDNPHMPEFSAREGIRALVLWPLTAGEETLAVLGVFDTALRAWSADDLQILDLLASQVAIVLDKLGRIESERRRAAYLAVLNEVGQAITSTLDLDHLLLTLLEKVREVAGAEACSVALIESPPSAIPSERELPAGSPGKLVFRRAVGGASQTVVGLQLDLGQGIAGWVAAQRQSALVPDVASDPRFFGPVDDGTGFITRDVVCVPLIVRDQVTGVIELLNKQAGQFGEDDVRLLESLAAQAAVAIENARLFEIERVGRQRLETLLYIGQAINSSLDVDTILSQVVGEAMRATGASRGSALVARPELGHFERRAMRGYSPELVKQAHVIPLPLERGVVGRAYRARRITRADDVLADPDYFPLVPDTRSEMAIPIIRGTQVTGAFDLQSPKADAFCDVDHDFLQALAYQAAIALENARLFQATRRQLNELHAVFDAALAGVTGQAFDETIARTTTALSQAWPDTSLGFMFVDETSQALRLHASYHGASPETIAAARIPPSQGIVGWAVRERQALRVGDALDDPRYIPGAPSTRSEMVAPLIVGDQVIGVINVESQQLDAFSEDDLRLLTTLTGQLATILEKTRLDTALETERTLLAQRVIERTAELSTANAELSRAARLKDEFLASMSHELRTPLNAILAMSEGLQEQLFGDLNEKQSKMVRTIEESGHHLLALINDILDLSKIEADKVELQLGPVAIGPLCQASLQFVRQAAHEKQVELTLNLDSRAATVEADERRLKQILVNLLSNAVKFTPRGGAVGLDVKADVEQPAVHFSVWDTGIGIAPENVDKLFKSFVQLDSSLSRQYSGTGLGLALVRRLVDLHGGSVSVESALGQGSRFTVSLPWREDDALAPQASVTRDSGQAHPVTVSPDHLVTILLAEDNETNIAATSAYLQAKGYRVILARNGNEAIQGVEENRPDVIVMDIQMPEMDGMEAIRRIRALPSPLAKKSKRAGVRTVPIIALTALAMPGDRERCLAAGADEYMSKPVSLKQLVTTIENSLVKVSPGPGGIT